MTTCPSWHINNETGRPPPIAVMFRVASEGARIRSQLHPHEDVLLQFSPKGSYRVEHVIEWLEWVIPRVLNGIDPDDVIVVLDWYKPHLDEAVKQTCKDLKVKVQYIGGGITGDVQVGDTHKHNPYQKKYRAAEIADAARQLELRPWRLPTMLRSVVLKRAWDTWAELSHDDPQRGYIHDGQLQPLTDEGDAEIASELLPIWMEIGMPALRREHIADVTEKWNQGLSANGINRWDLDLSLFSSVCH